MWVQVPPPALLFILIQSLNSSLGTMPKKLLSLVVIFFSGFTFAAETIHQKDVVYGRKYGLALTMDVFKPTVKSNGAGVIIVISGGWFSNPAAINESQGQTLHQSRLYRFPSGAWQSTKVYHSGSH